MSKEKNEKKVPEVVKREEEVLRFWQKEGIFEKTLEKDAPEGEFVFYDGPPFATGLPHSGSLLSSVIKDVIPRYKTMRGFRVRRRWGWDCHGLPIENMIEKELGLKTKKDIEKIGIKRFNQACRDAVVRCEEGWRDYVNRIGRWVDFDNSFKTMDNSFIESVWWALGRLNKKKLLYEGKKVLLYCPHCETPLAKAEIAQDNSYKDVTEEAITVKFKVINPKKYSLPENTHMLAWTTTPWTIPANTALAVGADIDYGLYDKEGTTYVMGKESAEGYDFLSDAKLIETRKGKEFVGITYEPPYKIEAAQSHKGKKFEVFLEDYVSVEDGTGIVHSGTIYGEEDFALIQREGLPMLQLLDESGHYNDLVPEYLQGLFIKKAEKVIKDDLEKRKLLFEKKNNTHSYPHCHRCDTALLYNALSSWFIDVQAIKDKLIASNEEIYWFPGHLKHGRFLHTIESAPDWTISRNRYWAAPIPVWKNKDGKQFFVDSVEAMQEYVKKSGNNYFIIRHGESELNTKGILNAELGVKNQLTEKGKKQVEEAVKELKGHKIDLVYYSPLQRTTETAELICKGLGLDKSNMVVDERIREIAFGEYEQQHVDAYHAQYKNGHDRLTKTPEGGENWNDVRMRVGDFLYDIEKKNKNKNILIVAHNGVHQMFQAVANGLDAKVTGEKIGNDSLDLKKAEIRKINFVPLPHNDLYELDLHRPYIDEIELFDEKGERLVRVPEVIDGWVESSSMPFAEYHYPFENKKKFEKRRPGDFIAEYIGQTRTWFYYLHVMSNALFGGPAFKNVITTGNVLAEDGSKMSKSKKNYTDPLILVNQFGADAFRYYLMRSVVMQAEDVRFTDEDIKEIQNRIINILFNVYKFYSLYEDQYDGKTKHTDSTHVLDRWILSKLSHFIEKTTEGFEEYNTVKASKPLRDFVNDFSTWYIRRSRDRFKGDDEKDRQYALATTRFVLQELSKTIAPLMPFMAEYLYSKVKVKKSAESVHLEKWPEKGESDETLLKEMQKVRDVISLGLKARDTAGIKVRQPLQSVTIPEEEYADETAMHDIVKDELNVKELHIKKCEDVTVDTNLTPELLAEGQCRDLLRHIQSLRKKAGLQPSDVVMLRVETDESGKGLIEQFNTELRQTAGLQDILFEKVSDADPVTIGESAFKLKLTS